MAEQEKVGAIGAAEAVWDGRADIIAANALDLDFGRNKGLSDAMMDRLMLDEVRIQGIVDGLRAVRGPDDKSVLTWLTALAEPLLQLGRFDEAAEVTMKNWLDHRPLETTYRTP